MTPLAHGVGARADLPVPAAFVVVGGGVVIAASFVALVALWRQPRLRGAAAGRPVPAALERLVDAPATTAVLRLLALAFTGLVLAVAWFGSPAVPYNLAPWVLYVTFWVGLIPVSLLLGPLWARVNPLRTVHALLTRLMGPAPAPQLVDRLGYYPAAVSLLAFAWLELASPDRSNPRRVALFLTAYAIVQLMLAAASGARWFARGDGFEVYARLLGRLAFVGRRADGRLVWRSPLNGVDGLTPERGLWSVVVVLVGSTAFDGVTRTARWQSSRLGESGSTGGATLGLAVVLLLVALGYLLATRRHRDDYAGSLVPIAAGDAIAHYFSLLLLDGQTTWILASDPFHTGADLFGTAGKVVDYTVVSSRTISVVQVVAIVGAHLVGLQLAHERALVGERGRQWVAQLPMLLVMVGLTSGGLALLLGT